MAYEYKEEIENHIICAPVHVDDEVFDEIEEVYRKAKAFNKISNLIESNYVDYGENNLEDVEAIVNEYWEDK